MRTSALTAVVLPVWIWVLQAPGGAAETSPAALSARQAADSLKRDAADMIVTPDAPSRAARLVALSRFTLRLLPNDPETLRTFANVIYPSQGRLDSAARALDAYLAARPGDHYAALRRMDLALADKDTAEGRLAYLASLSADSSRPGALRSEAHARRGQILIARGLRPEAKKAFERALGLDPGNASALAGRLGLMPNPATADRAEALLADLSANAGGAATANELADLIQAAGLHDQAIVFYTHLHVLADRPGSTRQARHLAAVRLFNAMLDAGQHAGVTEMLPPIIRTFSSSVDLRSLLAEAWRGAGNDEKADEQIAAIWATYRPAHDSGRVSTALAGELAMFFLVTRPDAENARIYADQIARKAGDDPVAQRLVGGAKIAQGRKDRKDRKAAEDLIAAGRRQLDRILDRDLYAAVLLAKDYLSDDDLKAAEKAIRAGLKLPRGGPACRQLLELVARYNELVAKRNPAGRSKITVMPVPGSKQLAALLDKHGIRTAPAVGRQTVGPQADSLRMRWKPDKFIRITIEPIGESSSGTVRMLPGEPLAVTLTLENISSVPVPLGKRGLLEPAVALDVTVEGGRIKKHLVDLPMGVWPAPRYLRPGQALRTIVSLDVGRLGRLLAETPLTELTLTVNATVSPVRPFGKVISTLPMKVKPLKIVRTDLLGRFDRGTAAAWPKRYQYTLGMIVRDMKRGDLAQRMRAARQVAALLALARGIERDNAAAPAPLAGHVTKPVLLTMTREVLKDTSYAVRAEMIAALGGVPIDKHIRLVLVPAAGDPHPLVRFRLAELLVATRVASARPVIATLAKDTDELVRLMAGAFGKRRPPARR